MTSTSAVMLCLPQKSSISCVSAIPPISEPERLRRPNKRPKAETAKGCGAAPSINRAIEGIHWRIHPLYGKITPEEEATAVIKINPATKKYAELKIRLLQDSPRDVDKLKEILQAKEEEYEKAQDSEDIERLIIEIEMLNFLLFFGTQSKK